MCFCVLRVISLRFTMIHLSLGIIKGTNRLKEIDLVFFSHDKEETKRMNELWWQHLLLLCAESKYNRCYEHMHIHGRRKEVSYTLWKEFIEHIIIKNMHK